MVDFAKMLQQRRDELEAETEKRVAPFMKVQGTKLSIPVSISVAGADYAIRFPYDAKLVQALQAVIPRSERAWHKIEKVWLVSPEEIEAAIKAMQPHTSQTITLPEAKPGAPEVLEKNFLLEYLGATQDRGKRRSAYGSVNGDWSAEFPEDVLRAFFEGKETDQKPDGLQTLYQVLCVVESVEPDKIKSAYKRLARQWHPDVCHEENASEMFRKINEAYLILIDPEKRKRYDAGLYFEREGQSQGYTTKLVRRPDLYGYRAPLRCGQITARGTVRLMRFIVSEILTWDDVTNDQGQVMTSTWPKDSDKFQILWV